jgi:hypothetical protein
MAISPSPPLVKELSLFQLGSAAGAMRLSLAFPPTDHPFLLCSYYTRSPPKSDSFRAISAGFSLYMSFSWL